jgi:hypothetical protein
MWIYLAFPAGDRPVSSSECMILSHSKLYLSKNKQVMVAWLVGDHLLLGDFGPYGIIFMSVCFYNSSYGNAVKEC